MLCVVLVENVFASANKAKKDHRMMELGYSLRRRFFASLLGRKLPDDFRSNANPLLAQWARSWARSAGSANKTKKTIG